MATVEANVIAMLAEKTTVAPIENTGHGRAVSTEDAAVHDVTEYARDAAPIFDDVGIPAAVQCRAEALHVGGPRHLGWTLGSSSPPSPLEGDVVGHLRSFMDHERVGYSTAFRGLNMLLGKK